MKSIFDKTHKILSIIVLFILAAFVFCSLAACDEGEYIDQASGAYQWIEAEKPVFEEFPLLAGNRLVQSSYNKLVVSAVDGAEVTRVGEIEIPLTNKGFFTYGSTIVNIGAEGGYIWLEAYDAAFDGNPQNALVRKIELRGEFLTAYFTDGALIVAARRARTEGEAEKFTDSLKSEPQQIAVQNEQYHYGALFFRLDLKNIQSPAAASFIGGNIAKIKFQKDHFFLEKRTYASKKKYAKRQYDLVVTAHLLSTFEETGRFEKYYNDINAHYIENNSFYFVDKDFSGPKLHIYDATLKETNSIDLGRGTAGFYFTEKFLTFRYNEREQKYFNLDDLGYNDTLITGPAAIDPIKYREKKINDGYTLYYNEDTKIFYVARDADVVFSGKAEESVKLDSAAFRYMPERNKLYDLALSGDDMTLTVYSDGGQNTATFSHNETASSATAMEKNSRKLSSLLYTDGRYYAVGLGFISVLDEDFNLIKTNDIRLTVKVVFDSDGGTEITPVIRELGDKFLSDDIRSFLPEKAGYRFVKWENVDNVKFYNLKTDVRLKAVWEAE